MAKLTSISKEEIGMSPDKLFFRGTKREEEVKVHVIDYDTEILHEETIESINDILKYKDKKTTTWINIDGLQNTDLLEKFAELLDLGNLVMPETLDVNARARILEYEQCTLMSIKTIKKIETKSNFEVNNLTIILNKNTLITIQEEKSDLFNPILERIRSNKKRIRKNGTDYLAYAILDLITDDYLYNLSILGAHIDEIEDKLLINHDPKIIDDINFYKRELNFLRKNIKPAKEMILNLNRIDSTYLKAVNLVYLKGVLDNISHASETTDGYREILSDQLNIYNTNIGYKLNDIMKFLTIFSVIFTPLTFIAGIYGTNFEYLPELKHKYSYFVMWGVMIVLAITMLLYFKIKKWL